MHRNMQGWQKWRRLTACLLIYALFIHGIVLALSTAVGGPTSTRPSADGAGAADWAGFEPCRHDNTAPGEPGSPGGQSGDTHCVFCVAGPGFVLEPSAVSTVFCPVELSIAPWPLAVWRLASTTVDASARPRGPPPAA
jgi:hypothetical protein